VLELSAVVLVGAACAALGLASDQYPVFAFLLAIALAGPFVRTRLTSFTSARAFAALGVPFVLLRQVRPIDGSSGLGFNTEFYVATFLVCAVIARLWSPPDRHRLVHALFGTGIALALCGKEVKNAPFGACVAAWAFASLAITRGALATQRSAEGAVRGVKLGIVVALLAGMSVATFFTTRWVLKTYNESAPTFVNFLQSRSHSHGGGFSGQARLGSISEMRGDGGREIALRAFARAAPGYLRGKVFAEYARSEWRAPSSGQSVAPERNAATAGMGRVALPGRTAPRVGREPELSVFPSSTYTGHFFLPLDAAAFTTASPEVTVFPGGACEDPASEGGGYDVFLERAPLADDARDPVYRALPADPELGRALDATLAKLERRDGSLESALHALVHHFSTNYTYRVGVHFDPGSDPMTQFLTQLDKGHCELFASAGTLLLRRMGFAARYVTGFICAERGASSDLWLARNEHGHAWVEVFDEERGGWRTAEFTPDSGLPRTEAEEGAWTARLEALSAEARRLSALSSRVGVAGVVRAFGTWLLARWYRTALVAVALAALFWRRVRRRRPRASVVRASVLPPDLERERKKLLELEHRLARAGFPRSPAETLEEYARRLDATEYPARRECATFLRDYGAKRYAPR
jgi:transglutaminase-like putative cysteine protease